MNVLYAPLNTLKRIDENIWVVDGPEIDFRYAGMHLPFPTRITVVQLPDDNVWVHSPIEPDDTLFEAVSAIGAMRYVIVPPRFTIGGSPIGRRAFPKPRSGRPRIWRAAPYQAIGSDRSRARRYAAWLVGRCV